MFCVNSCCFYSGTFGDIDHILLVGVCGGVPHYTDYYNHVRLGDIIISSPNTKGQSYIYCDKAIQDVEKGTVQYSLKGWAPSQTELFDIAKNLKEENVDSAMSSWEQYIVDGQGLLEGQEVAFARPPRKPTVCS